MQRAMRGGFARRAPVAPFRIGLDQTSFQERHEYVSAITDSDNMDVLYMADDRRTGGFAPSSLTSAKEDLAAIEVVAMDMWKPYIKAIETHAPNSKRKIAFDKFHVSEHLGNAVDKVRRQEHRDSVDQGDHTLDGCKHLWFQDPKNKNQVMWESTFQMLKETALKTAEAGAYKGQAMCL